MPGLSSLQVNIKDQPHNLAWINEAEQALLKDLGGSGRPGPMGIPAYEFNYDDDQDLGDVTGSPGGAAGASGGGAGAGAGTGGGDTSGDTGGDPFGEYGEGGPDRRDATYNLATNDFNFARDRDASNFRDDLDVLGIENINQAGSLQDYYRDLGKDVNITEDKDGTYNYTGKDALTTALGEMGKAASWAGQNLGAAGIIKAFYNAVTGKPSAWDAFPPSTPPSDTLTTTAKKSQAPVIDESRDDGNADEEIIPETDEEETEEEELGTMEQFFVDRDIAQGSSQNEVLNNMIERLGIQNRTIEPFNQWLAGQSEAMRAADMTTQTNEYRKSLRDQTSPAQSYLPIVQPAADRTTEQSFINNLYPSSKKTSATDALYAELGI